MYLLHSTGGGGSKRRADSLGILEEEVDGRMIEDECASHQKEEEEVGAGGVQTMIIFNIIIKINITTLQLQLQLQHYNLRKSSWITWACTLPRNPQLLLLSATTMILPHPRRHMQGEQSGVKAAADDPWGLCVTSHLIRLLLIFPVHTLSFFLSFLAYSILVPLWAPFGIHLVFFS
jgi:hypothetical protein